MITIGGFWSILSGSKKAKIVRKFHLKFNHTLWTGCIIQSWRDPKSMHLYSGIEIIHYTACCVTTVLTLHYLSGKSLNRILQNTFFTWSVLNITKHQLETLQMALYFTSLTGLWNVILFVRYQVYCVTTAGYALHNWLQCHPHNANRPSEIWHWN